MIAKLFQTVLRVLWRAALVIVAVTTMAGITLTAMTLPPVWEWSSSVAARGGR